jgi:HK97 family phage major capsid protein
MARRIPVPTNAEEQAEILADRQYVKELMSDPEAFASWTEDSINARLKSDPAILAQTKEQTENFMIEWLRDQQESTGGVGGLDPVTARRLNMDSPNARAKIKPNTLYNKNAVGAKFDSHFDSAAQLLYSISDHSVKDSGLSKKLNELKNDLSSVKPSDGGFLIPEILRAEILRVALERAVVRSRARVIPMDSLTVPFPTVDSTSNVSSVFGGVVGYWTEEGATLTESQPRFGRIELRANKLVLYTEVPNELIRDAQPSMEAFISGIFPEAIAWYEDVAFFVGGGAGEPLGFLNAPAKVSVTRAAGGNDVEWVDIVKMYSRMLPQSLDRAVWIVSPDTLPSLLQMTVGTNQAAIWMGGGNFASGAGQPPMAMLGIPLIVSEKAAATGTAGDINLVDFGFYLIGDRQAMSAAQSQEFRFQNDITAFRVTERLDGRPWLQAPITPQNGGATLSPFVQLL